MHMRLASCEFSMKTKMRATVKLEYCRNFGFSLNFIEILLEKTRLTELVRSCFRWLFLAGNHFYFKSKYRT